jgi:hypothetical protein
LKPPHRAVQKKLDYPNETRGSRLAAKARTLASKLTPEQRREHFNGAMTMIPPVSGIAAPRQRSSHAILK